MLYLIFTIISMNESQIKVENYISLIQIKMQKNTMSYPCDQQTIQRIINILHQNPNAKRIILQFPKQYLTQAFALTKQLKKICKQTQSKDESDKREFYTLFDSMKKECCTDIIGAQHIDYDLLIHFGQACFSQAISPKHYYVFPTISKELQQHFKNSFASQSFVQDLINKKIKYLLTEQKLYEYAKSFLCNPLKKANVQLLKLPYDKKQTDQYLIFGYYAGQQQLSQSNDLSNENNNILAMFAEHPQGDNKLLSDIHITMGSFSSNKSLFSSPPQICVASLQVPQVEKSNFNYTKSLMMRLSLIGELQKHDVFGLLVSNAGTQFCKQMVQKCKTILQKHNKRYFVFMMNNLNEVKLGNFPQIEVYVVISCFNNSCFSMKDFYRLVVTPIDLEVAFDNLSISEYNFDLSHPRNLSHQTVPQANHTEIIQHKKPQLNENQLVLSVQQKQQIILANTLQTLDYYRTKEYKGLDFSEKMPVQKIKKGKIGLAQQYKPLPKEQTQF